MRRDAPERSPAPAPRLEAALAGAAGFAVAVVFSVAVAPGCGAPPSTEESASASTSGTEGASTSTAQGGEVDCEIVAYVPETPLEVTIVNAGAAPVYLDVAVRDFSISLLDEYYAVRPFDVVDPATDALLNERGICFNYERCSPSYWCPYTFDLDNDPCNAAPGRPSPILVAPGGRYTPPVWDGLRHEDAELPYECQNLACGVPVNIPTRCRRPFSVTDPVVVRVHVGETMICADADPGGCDCTPNGDGWCKAGEGTIEALHDVSAAVDFPAAQSVELVIP